MAMLRTFLLLAFCLLNYLSSFSQNLDSAAWTRFYKDNTPLERNHIRHMVTDTTGRVWVTTDGRGLYHYYKGKWGTLIHISDESEGWMNQFIALQNGHYLICGIRGKLVDLDPYKLTYSYIPAPANQLFMSGVEASDGTVFLGGSNPTPGELWTYKNHKFDLLEYPASDPFTAFKDSDNSVIVSFRNGNKRYEKKGNKWVASDISGSTCYQLLKYDNRLYCTSYPNVQLEMYDDSQWITLNNLPAAINYNFNGISKYCAHKMAVSGSGRLILVTQFDPNIAILDSGKWRAWAAPVPKGEFDGIQCVMTDRHGNIWVGTWNHGIYMIAEKELLKLPEKPEPPKPEPPQYQPPNPIPPPGIRPPVIRPPIEKIYREDYE